jgi:hypothetical protein
MQKGRLTPALKLGWPKYAPTRETIELANRESRRGTGRPVKGRPHATPYAQPLVVPQFAHL